MTKIFNENEELGRYMVDSKKLEVTVFGKEDGSVKPHILKIDKKGNIINKL